jgi:phage shock protein PspC (stress-responsive transcriptional regulator)
MKKIEKVSIADISFTLDLDAYVSLKQYLDALHKCYDADPDGSEIIADIEARIAELILNEQVYTKVVNKRLIDTIVAQLGMPEEVEEESAETVRPTAQSTPDSSIPRRLYRSSEGRVFGGVCSGMAKYWDTSVVWFRLGIMAPLIMLVITAPFEWRYISDFFGGMSWAFFVLYLVLWMAIPIAKTPRQKLESRGEKITPTSIRQNLQSGATTPSSKKAASVGAEALTVIGRVVLFLIKLVVGVIGFGLLFGALVMLIAMVSVPVAVASSDALSIFGAGGSHLLDLLLVELILFSILVPCFVIGLSLLSLVFNWKMARLFYIITIAVWILSVMASVGVGIAAANSPHDERFVRDLQNEFKTKRRWISPVDRWEYRVEYMLEHSGDNYADEQQLFEDFIERESNGTSTITVTMTGDSVVVTSKYDVPNDSLSMANGTVLQSSKRMVLRDPEAVKKALEWMKEN